MTDSKDELIKLEHKNFAFEIKAIDEEDDEEEPELYCGKFEGWASTFGNEDSYGDIIEQGAFTDVINQMKACGKKPKALMQHSAYNEQGAVFTDIEETKKGLFVKGKFINTTRGRDLRVEVKTGAISDLSIGFICGDYKIEDKGKRKIRRIVTIKELPEISFVTFPANNKANITEAKSKPIDVREFEHSLKDLGFSNKEAKTIISAGYKAINHCDDDLNQREAEIIAEIKEIQKILIKGAK